MADLSPLILLSLLLSLHPPSATAGGAGFVYTGCSQPKYTPGSPYEYNVDSLLTSLANAASFALYSNFTATAATPSSPAYGLFQCRADTPIPDCSSCVRSALTTLSSLCPSAAGAAVQLDACFLRYGKDPFIGKPDTTLLYKRCGGDANGGTSSNLLSMRDAALASMQAAPAQGGTYRSSGAGNVQALSQCVGDIDVKECSDCVSTATSQLRASCGIAVSGDMYLGKCYVRYWSNGGGNSYDYNSHSGGSGSSSSSSSDDDTGKTLAIIIGVAAGVALIIIFLSYIGRRAGNGKG